MMFGKKGQPQGKEHKETEVSPELNMITTNVALPEELRAWTKPALYKACSYTSRQ